MPDNASATTAPTSPTPLTLLGLGAMGTALARTWLAAGHPLTVWNRSPGRSAELALRGARVADTAADAVAASPLVITCLLDDASVREALADADLTGKDLIDLTTSTPAESRARAGWAAERGARFLDGGIMAVPPMIGAPEAGGYILYSGPRALFDEHRDVLSVPAATRYVGEESGRAALYDVALLSAMTAMFAGARHAFALVENAGVDREEFGGLVAGWLAAMAPATAGFGSAPSAEDVTSPAVVEAGDAALFRTAREQGVDTGLLTASAGAVTGI
ncbi:MULTISPECIES: NAD(P)-dependent oxidoreductase [unclassified Streptomyces]|uniref:NAD(P)-dependent oxidoreductase n=1 Tax=unclassified Streptomyces TaxID=2593676 RepID=UPI00081E8F35|nr:MULTISPECIES: NAD(P)-binding domain-containing protein [unclassified Streptomyces]MYR95276.1 NAD(P)-binding domain-containing protein [Streptomyces sp. SID4937]SCD86935.1 3-hydroxyisobutyrate dehydrogenase [Streptomyces sp. ScaeMP-e83]